MLPNDIASAVERRAAQEETKWKAQLKEFIDSEALDRFKAALARVVRTVQDAAKTGSAAKPDTTVLDLGLESEYAVGKGLISRDDLTTFRNTYLTQSQLSLGLIPPLLFVIFALLVDTYRLPNYWPALILIAALSGFLFFLAIERRHKYRTELKLLLLGRLQKQLEADQAAKDAKKSAPDKPATGGADPLRKAIQEELKNLQLEVKPLVVELHATSKSKKSPAVKDPGPSNKQTPTPGGASATS